MGLFDTSGLVGKLVEWIKERLSSGDEGSDVLMAELDDGGKVKVKSGDDVELLPPEDRSSAARSFRRSHYGDPGEVKKAAVENHQVFSDVLSDPSLVGAGSEVEAVAEVAAAQLRHNSPNTTRKYDHARVDDRRDALDKID